MDVQCDYDDCSFVTSIGSDNMSLKDCADILREEWLGTPCPSCGRGAIVNEMEMETLSLLAELETMGLVSPAGETPAAGGDGCDLAVSINLGALRPESSETELMKVHTPGEATKGG